MVLFSPLLALAQKGRKAWSPLEAGKGVLTYHPDSLGNRIVDFSYCGYAASNEAIPDVSVKVVVPVAKGDATQRVQAALDYVAALPADQKGFRGTVLLQKGIYPVKGQLKMMAAGVVLRGSGMAAGGTIITGAGTDRETLVRVFGKNDRVTGHAVQITDRYVPVNATTITVADASAFHVGDKIIIHRPSTAAWIEALGTSTFGGGVSALGWKPGDRDVSFERTIVSLEKNTLTLDVPLTTALDAGFGGGTVAKLTWPGRIEKIGIENLRLQSAYDRSNPKDEAHRWMAITLENVADAWVRQVTFQHFAGSAVNVLASAKRVTIEDCKSLAPVSEIGGQRRYTFFTAGEQTLVQRCYAQGGYHDFSVGYCAPGPNAFVQCQSDRPFSFSGTIDSWSSGVLFDVVNVDGNALRFANRGQDGQGAGWTTANSVFWQCTASRIDCEKPPMANNYAFGSWAQFGGNGWWENSNEQILPRSLYYAQLSARLGDGVLKRAFLLPVETEASSSPPVEVAMALTKKAYEPLPQLDNWIDEVAKQNSIPLKTDGAKTIDAIGFKSKRAFSGTSPMHLENGWIVRNHQVVAGGRIEVPWWNGSVQPQDLPKMKPHLTRFVPGRTGTGLTDDLDSLTDWMQRSNTLAIEHNYGLWYERRRDDHERIRRMDGEVWPPFYELPFARSGKDTAWDGLSKYDLTKYNTWYWGRLKKFADLADQKGLVLVHQNYFQHNIIEAGAHYVDFPWRTANNTNGTPFNEPVNFAGDKRIFYADQFYNVAASATYRRLHEAYIRQCLNNFKENNGVIQYISAEYTGPLSFVQFWLDVIRGWEKENGKKEIIGLSTTKDVQDAVLADPVRSAVVNLIDIRYWHYQEDGTAYAPKGGQNLAPRQHARLLKPRRTSFEQVYRAVSEYRQKFPGKAVTYSGDNYDRFGWAVLMAGGSMPVLPKLDNELLASVAASQPVVDAVAKNQWRLKSANGCIVYASGEDVIQFPLAAGQYTVRYINPSNGTIAKEEGVQGGGVVAINWPQGPVVLWVTAKQKAGQHEASIQK